MKTSKFRLIPFFALLFFVFGNLVFQNCKPDEEDPPCENCAVAYKPNIYIYPTQTTHLNVWLNFPQGGNIISSIPEYGSGWNIEVDENGWINNQYNFLFYESSQPDIWQMESGWIVQQADLKNFFETNMENFGFYRREIEDFCNYWIPKLKDTELYAIYPQTATLINSVIELNLSENPDNILRLFYLIQEINSDNIPDLSEFEINSEFKREGFFVSEWGVILK